MATNLRISPVGQTVGTVEYCSPEQLMDRQIDGRSDLYGLGVLAFLLITGVHPFRGARSMGDIVTAQLRTVPAPVSTLRSGVPADVDALIACLLEKDASRRYPDAATLAAQLGLLLTGEPPDQGATVRTAEGEEDTFISEVPKPPRR